jgi:hypothetical protein
VRAPRLKGHGYRATVDLARAIKHIATRLTTEAWPRRFAEYSLYWGGGREGGQGGGTGFDSCFVDSAPGGKRHQTRFGDALKRGMAKYVVSEVRQRIETPSGTSPRSKAAVAQQAGPESDWLT